MNINKITIILLVLISTNYSSYGQALISPFGGTMETNNTCLSFSAGELIINSAESDDFILTQGFQQPEITKDISTNLTIASGLILDGNDGNGVFTVEELAEYPDNELIILNRLGEILFQAKPYQNDWNGYYNGQPLPQATYYYILYLDKAKTTISKGNIYILKP